MFDLKNLRERWRNDLRGLVSESWSVSWPVTIIMFYEFLIGIADVYVAGFFGKEAQAAYGIAFQLYFTFIIIGIALSVGSSSVVSRFFTADRRGAYASALGTSVTMSVCLGALFTCAGVAFAGHAVGMLNVPREIRPIATRLLTVYAGAFVFDYFLINANGIMRSSGAVKKSLVIMTVVCVMNIALNFVFAFTAGLGYIGIAAATVVSIAAGAAMAFAVLWRETPRIFRFSRAFAREIAVVGWPSGIMHISWNLAGMALLLIIARLPARMVETLAAYTNGLKVESAIFLPAFAFNMANSAVVGNLLGRREGNRAFVSGILTAVIGVVFVGALTVATLLNAGAIAGSLSPDRVVVGECMRYIYIALAFEPVMAWGIILGGALNGAGDTRTVMKISTLSLWLLRLPLAYAAGIVFGRGAVAIWWAMNASILVQTLFLTRRYFGKRWVEEGLAILDRVA